MLLVCLLPTLATVVLSDTPVVIWHGVNSDSGEDQHFADWIHEKLPDKYVRLVRIGSSDKEDKHNSKFMNANKQVSRVCEMIHNDTKLKNGYHAMGVSQGGLLFRALAQRCPNPPIRNFISFGGPQQGVYGVPNCEPDKQWYCEFLRKLFDTDDAWRFAQWFYAPAQYWHDPCRPQDYKKYSSFLADINNEKEINQDYRKNLVALQNLVLVSFLRDETVIPKESENFAFYKSGQDKTILPLNQSAIYIQDRIGLKEIDADGRLHYIQVDERHTVIKKLDFLREIVDKYFT